MFFHQKCQIFCCCLIFRFWWKIDVNELWYFVNVIIWKWNKIVFFFELFCVISKWSIIFQINLKKTYHVATLTIISNENFVFFNLINCLLLIKHFSFIVSGNFFLNMIDSLNMIFDCWKTIMFVRRILFLWWICIF